MNRAAPLLLLLCLAPGCRRAAEPSPPPTALASMESASFEPLRPPVLGHAVEWDRERDLYRLVSTAEPPEVLAIGSLPECERELVSRLEAAHGAGRFNLEFGTLGGKQFWGDAFWFADWRIQENVFTGHFRLLDPEDRRRAWGTREACRAAFERFRLDEAIELESEHLVILLHGLGRTRSSFDRLRDALPEAGYDATGIGYPSTRRSIAEHADGLVELLDSLEGVARVSFVTHSLGGLVAREALSREAPWKERIEVHRLLMLAPPSRGSSLASALEDFMPFRAIAGPSGRGVALEEARAVPLPACRFGIIAGGRGDGRGWNPLLEGDDDGVVAVEEARLEGAEDFLLVDGLHSFLMRKPEVIEAAIRYLDTGSFGESGPR